MSAAATTTVIDASRRLEINHEPWAVRRLSTFYEKPTIEHPSGNGRLYLPRHQREWSWTGAKGLKKMRKFIDSILHNYPIHTIILNAIDDGTRERWEIYDGRHRVETLWRFVHNEFALVLEEGTVAQRVVYYRDLCDADRARFNDRQIPVATTSAATPAQLAEVFIRLNSGKPLKQADYCWACRDTPLIRSTMEILEANKERFRALFGGVDITLRGRLPDWVGLFAGLVTNNAGNMTTSFERLNLYLDSVIPIATGTAAMDALFDLYTRANTTAVVPSKTLKAYQAIGFVNAFFMNDWMTSTDKTVAIADWVRVIVHIRTTKGGAALVKVGGAQNLNSERIARVRVQVQHWLTSGHITGSAATEDSFSDNDEDDATSTEE
jgi:hypothetical protein